jgi:hypothetical protein
MGLLRSSRRLFGRQFPAGRGVVAPSELGLDEFPPLGVFLQFSAPGPGHSRVSLNRLAAAAASHGGDVVVVEQLAGRGGRLAGRLGVHVAPTVLYVGPDGCIVRRWTRPPERRELDQALDGAGV